MVRPSYIKHVAVIVSDMDRSLDFYCNTLGFEVVEKVDLCTGEGVDKIVGLKDVALKIAHLKLPEGPTLVELLEYIRPKGKPYGPDHRSNDIGVGHFAMYVEEIEEFCNILKSKGVKFISPGVVFSSTDEKCCYFYGPDGEIIEIIKPPKAPLKDLSKT